MRCRERMKDWERIILICYVKIMNLRKRLFNLKSKLYSLERSMKIIGLFIINNKKESSFFKIILKSYYNNRIDI
jgi:hypothetical protein